MNAVTRRALLQHSTLCQPIKMHLLRDREIKKTPCTQMQARRDGLTQARLQVLTQVGNAFSLTYGKGRDGESRRVYRQIGNEYVQVAQHSPAERNQQKISLVTCGFNCIQQTIYHLHNRYGFNELDDDLQMTELLLTQNVEIA